MSITTKVSISKLILDKYKSYGLEPALEDFWVRDTRNNNLTGPYTRSAAREMVLRLHEYLERNGFDIKPFVIHYIDGTTQE